MKMVVQRVHKTVDGMFGMLSLDTVSFSAFSAENLTKMIPAGIYDVRLDYSPRMNMITPHIIVPARDQVAGGDAGIRIHPANYPNQLEGCLAVGDAEEPDAVDNSRVTFNHLLKILSQVTSGIQIEVRDIPAVTDAV